MKISSYSYRYAVEILQHANHRVAWDEVFDVLVQAPLFIYPKKSAANPNLDVVQQLMNVYFDRRLAVDMGWDFHPLATRIANSGLAADFRKTFQATPTIHPATGVILNAPNPITLQAEVQFGNMARWYSDIFKFQTAYSQELSNVGLCIVPMNGLASRIDSNVSNYERVLRELPSANLSITLPIAIFGLEPDQDTPIVDVRQCQFNGIGQITGRGNNDNLWRVVNGYLSGTPMLQIGPNSPIGPRT